MLTKVTPPGIQLSLQAIAASKASNQQIAEDQQNMKTRISFLAGAVLAAGLGLPLLVTPVPARAQGALSQTDQDRERSTEAYRDGYGHGQDDARAGVRNDMPGDRWTLPSDQTAWKDGYSAGYQEIASQGAAPGISSSDLNSDPARFGYDDGLAQGRKDKQKGEAFRPTNGEFYKHSDHGWTPDYGDKQH